jgi:hypothetical protein
MTMKRLLLPFALVMSLEARAQSGWQVDSQATAEERAAPAKNESGVQPEKALERRRVVITRRTTEKKAPQVFREELEWEKARSIRLDQKTQELIEQLENLAKRPGQEKREGEIKMRLAELYFDRALATSVRESEAWEKDLRQWEVLPDAEKARRPRPPLRTPKADEFRKRALQLYAELERNSRGGDRGRSRMIQRDEVLFYLGSTLVDLGRGKEAAPYLEEMVGSYPSSGRLFGARLRLADLYFESGQFAKAVPHYLRLATGEGAPTDGQHLKAYSLYKLGWCYLNLGESGKAVLAFRRTLDASRENPSERRVVFEREALNDLTRAFALAGQWDEGENFFKGIDTEEGQRLLRDFRVTAAETARDNGNLPAADKLYGRLLENYGRDPQARDWALERAQLSLKSGRPAAYAAALEKVAKDYGPGSSWLSDQSFSEAEKNLVAEESSALLRREAKARHNAAQRRNKIELYRDAEPFYAAYFRIVPEPVGDAPENVHEMRFYHGELLYRLGRFDEAGKAYAAAGDGKYGPVAAYNRILSLREAARKNKGLSAELVKATEDFVDRYPKDDRANELLYSSAEQAFQGGDAEASLDTLRRVVERTPDKQTGVEAAERILFIHEKNKSLDAALTDSEAFASNAQLMKTGGPKFAARVKDYRDRARFKKIEEMPDATSDEQVAKARAFKAASAGFSGELREKALNNASVFAEKGGDANVRRSAREALLKDFPNSGFVQDVYGERAAQAAREGRWSDALANYRLFLKNADKPAAPAAKGKKPVADAGVENATWNMLYIRAHLDGFWPARAFPDRDIPKDLVSDLRSFLDRFPNARARPDAITVLALRKGATAADVNALKKLPKLTVDERATLEEGEVLATARDGSVKDVEALVKRFPPAKAQSSLILKDALGQAAFRSVEARYQAYARGKLDSSPSRFAKSLQARVSDVEKLESDYLRAVSYGNGSVALQSLERLARLFNQLASEIDRAGTKPEEKEALAQYSKPLRDKSVGFLRSCFEKAVEYKIGGAGLAACRSAAKEYDPSLLTVTDEILADPRWVPQIPAGSEPRPLVRTARSAFAAGRMGEFLLAESIATGDAQKSGAGDAQEPLRDLERAELENLKGLFNVRFGRLEAATRIFRAASDVGAAAQSGNAAELASVRTAALKNLAGLYVSVGDFNLALDTLSTLVETDPDVAWMKGTALRGTGKPAEAVQAYSRGLLKTGNNPTLLFNMALAQGAAGDTAGAATTMQKYVELETPSGSHPSRALLKTWKGMQK